MSEFTAMQGGLAQLQHASTRVVNSLTLCPPSKSLATVWLLALGRALAISYRLVFHNALHDQALNVPRRVVKVCS